MNILHLTSARIPGGGERDLRELARAQGATVITPSTAAMAEFFGPMHGGSLRMGGMLDVFSPIRLSKRLDTLDGDTLVHTWNVRAAAIALSARRLMRAPARVRVILSFPAETGETRRLKGLDRLVTDSLVHPGYPDYSLPRVTPEDGVFRIIRFGEITHRSRLQELIRALEPLLEFPGWRLEVCGTGKSRDVMPAVRLARGLGVDARIDWLGDDADVDERLARASLAVFPGECVGRDKVRAMYAGVPVITGLDTAELRRYIEDPALTERDGAGARARALRAYDFKTYCSALQALYLGGEASRLPHQPDGIICEARRADFGSRDAFPPGI